MIELEAPDAVFLDELVFVHRPADRGAPAETHLLEHPDPDFRALPVLSYVDDGLNLQVVAQAVLDGTFLAIARESLHEEFPHMILPLVHAALGKLDRSVLGEQVCKIVEEILVEVVAVRTLEILDLEEILHTADTALGGGNQIAGVIHHRFARLEVNRHQRRLRQLGCRPADRGVVSSIAGRGIAIVERRNVCLWIDLVRLARRLVGWELEARHRHRLRVLGPSLVIVGDEGRIEVQRPELPHSALFHVAVLVDPLGPVALAAVVGGQVELPTARARVEPAWSHINDGLQLQMIAQMPPTQPLRSPGIEESPDVGFADIDTGPPPLQGALAGEQVRRLIPHAAVDVVAVDALQVLDLLLVFQKHRAVCQGLGSRNDISFGRAGLRAAGMLDGGGYPHAR